MTRDIAHLEAAIEAFDTVIFLGAIAAHNVTCGWMRFRRNKAEMVYGRYVAEDRRVEISGVLRHPWVPEYVFLSVLHHELLHVVFGEDLDHGHAFRLAERAYVHTVESDMWCQVNFDRLLAARPPAKESAC
jgi:hypothetical protein